MDDFYQAFENKFRGDRELIKNRLSVYLHFIQPLKSLYPDSPVIDLGCGRGEWLELLGEYGGFTPRGVDLSAAMLNNAKVQGLLVEQQDALVCLKALPDGSQSIVSGFHIAEHLEFIELQTLVGEAHRVLKPGGLLILETPNPENIIVGTTSFYMDPTHLQPLPPDLLEFLAAYAGFCRVKIIRLQEPYNLDRHGQVTLLNVLDGVSPDYAVVAQKQADSTSLALFDQPFDDDYGLTLSALATRFNLEQSSRSAQADERYQEISHTNRELAEGHSHLAENYSHLVEQLHRLDESHQGLMRRLQYLENQTVAALTREADLLSSKSWRYTQILRRIANWFRTEDK
ncbi:MAG: class I SAM-dependent methyltransferase [Porticoccaceae bacterium]|nr:class I SAM-dependent methyltransferase [Porticoccaceae bacterium]